MKNNSSKGAPDPKLHVRKKLAGGATGAMLGAALAGPIGALLGGAVGTMIGGAAEQGRSLEMPKRMSKRMKSVRVKARARGKTGVKRAKGSTRSTRPVITKKTEAPRSKRAAGTGNVRSKR
jgi:hypothetical protein